MQFLDYLYHTSLYQNWTSYGPLKLPIDALNQGADIATTVSKVVTSVTVGSILGGNASSAIKQFHVPLPRNFIRSLNGLIQAVAMLITALVLKQNKYSFPFFPLLLMSTCWSSASVRHLIAANYPNKMIEDTVKNSKWFFQ